MVFGVLRILTTAVSPDGRLLGIQVAEPMDGTESCC